MLNDGSGRFTLGPRLPVEEETNAIEAMDFDGDGHGVLDLYLAGRGSHDRLLLGMPTDD